MGNGPKKPYFCTKVEDSQRGLSRTLELPLDAKQTFLIRGVKGGMGAAEIKWQTAWVCFTLLIGELYLQLTGGGLPLSRVK